MFQHKKMIYLDNASATPLDRTVARKMAFLSKTVYANPSALHTASVAARRLIEDARATTARLLFAHADEIIFTSSGTESDALAIVGVITQYERKYTDKKIPHIVTTVIEHPAVLENCRMLQAHRRAEVTYVPCDARGIVDPKEIKNALRENTVLVSVMYANNEIGTLQPIAEIAKEIRHFRKQKAQVGLVQGNMHKSDLCFPLLHTDACQAMNYVPLTNIEKLGVDLLSFNSSKIYGPKGVGFLYKKRSVVLSPIYGGGGQEFGLRSGTEDTVSIVGAVCALEQTWKIKEKESTRLIELRDYAIEKLNRLSVEYTITLNGDQQLRLPNNINISIAGISSELLVIELDARGIAVSSKSACKSDEPDESYVIGALQKAQGEITDSTDGSIRISLGRSTTKKDIDSLVSTLGKILEKYKKFVK